MENIHLLSIIGEIEGHENLSNSAKATKYEHVLPSLAMIEDSKEIRGVLVIFFFPSDRWKLQGYFYPCKGAKGMVVVCHGMHAGADDYIPFIEYFVRSGYAVFTYDCQGTYASQGDSTVGMCTPLVNLDHALTFIE